MVVLLLLFLFLYAKHFWIFVAFMCCNFTINMVQIFFVCVTSQKPAILPGLCRVFLSAVANFCGQVALIKSCVWVIPEYEVFPLHVPLFLFNFLCVRGKVKQS